ncbi:hypothetical protein IVB33_05420 [Bradyrhizobium sp. 24]|uniref:hypothetical protein n=1 Tax=unclassified Bradyrhizobium TaxID=2631580 RepID=UPI001FF9F742|nr:MULTISPECIES: hypothetical protein [unclassified Bradyrhizobium]MCK1298146.1 hypothetical protein [Bradyrhizobium sp. 37]MCK1377788.1 hypothetical protein [Bradyrhizobium sp. 24]MCK1773172.1 hypothetical protein [Bradyrhizobium sp. 134]
MTADGSMAVWGRRKAGTATAATVEVHFNYWRIAGSKVKKTSDAKKLSEIAGKDFVEIGIFLRGAAEVDQFSVYLPGVGTDWRLEDCGHRFAELEIAQGIFNLQLSSHLLGAPGPKRIDLVEAANGNFCRVHVFPTVGDSIDPTQLIQSPNAEGLVVTITQKAITEACYQHPADKPVYFRLRAYYVGADKRNPFVKTVKPYDRFLQTGFSVVEYLDFRLNEARTLPGSIETLMRQGDGTLVPTILVAFLTAVPVQSDVTTISWDKTHKKRVLENDLWTKYVPTGIPRGMTVIHWKDEGKDEKPIRDFSAFVKMQTRLVSWPLLLTSFAVAFIFGILGNLSASWIWERTQPPSQVKIGDLNDRHARPRGGTDVSAKAEQSSANGNANLVGGQND